MTSTYSNPWIPGSTYVQRNYINNGNWGWNVSCQKVHKNIIQQNVQQPSLVEEICNIPYHMYNYKTKKTPH